jgi:hypothetical protein
VILILLFVVGLPALAMTALAWRLFSPVPLASRPVVSPVAPFPPEAFPINARVAPGDLKATDPRRQILLADHLAQRSPTSPDDPVELAQRCAVALCDLWGMARPFPAAPWILALQTYRFCEIGGEQDQQARREELRRALLPLLESQDGRVRTTASQAAVEWGTTEHVPALIALIQEGSDRVVGDRTFAIAALARIKDPRGIEAVAARLVDGWDRGQSKLHEALVRCGPAAEDAVLPYITKGASTGPAACAVLKEIGTSKSIPALKAASTDIWAGQAAQDALKAIEARIDKK